MTTIIICISFAVTFACLIFGIIFLINQLKNYIYFGHISYFMHFTILAIAMSLLIIIILLIINLMMY